MNVQQARGVLLTRVCSVCGVHFSICPIHSSHTTTTPSGIGIVYVTESSIQPVDHEYRSYTRHLSRPSHIWPHYRPHTSWQNVYWLALGLQLLVLFLLMVFMPEYGAINSIAISQLLKTYPNILCSILTLYYKHPILVQAGLLSFSTFFAVSSFWTNVTFLLAGPIYD